MSTHIDPTPQTEMPVPVLYWPRHRYAKWIIGGFMILWTLVLWFMSRSGTRFWGPQFYLLIMPTQLYVISTNVRHVLSGGVLSIIRATGTVRRVPLATAELSRTATGAMRMRWTEGKRTQSVAASLSVPFMDELQRTALAARSAEPGSTPASEAKAARAVAFGLPAVRVGWLIIPIILLTALYVAATYWNQPLLLLPLALIVLVIDRPETNYVVMLSGDHLWILRPGKTAHPIPLKDVQGITNGTNTSVIITSDANYPVIRLNRYQSGDFLKQLKRRLHDTRCRKGVHGYL